jgi:hypothetical protein
MRWEATDQFGNLYVAEVQAKSIADLMPCLESLIDEVRARAGEVFRLTIDYDYSEISGPDPERVSHMLRVPWLGAAGREATEVELVEAVRGLLATRGLGEATVGVA